MDNSEINKNIMIFIGALLIAIIIISITTIIEVDIEKQDVIKYKPVVNNSDDRSDPIGNLNKHPQFHKNGFMANKINIDSKKVNSKLFIKISKAKAMKIASRYQGYYTKNSKKVTAELVKFTDNDTKGKIPNKDVILKNYPAWIVTYYGVSAVMSGGLPVSTTQKSQKAKKYEHKFVDYNIVIDAATGQKLETFEYNSYLNDKDGN